MSKSILIEILQGNSNSPRFGMGDSGNIVTNPEFSNSNNWTLTQPSSSSCSQLWSISGGLIKKTSTSNCSYFEQPASLTEGLDIWLKLSLKITIEVLVFY